MGEWMNCCQKKFARRKKETKKISEKGEEGKAVVSFELYTRACKLDAYWDVFNHYIYAFIFMYLKHI